MPHGLPDWGLVGPRRTTYGLNDVGEMAVRLGSPHLWDRRGDVIYLNAFKEGLGGLETYAFGGSCGVVLSTGHTRQGAFSVKLTCDGVAICTAGVDILLPLPVYSGIGLEHTFSWQEAGDVHYQQLHWQSAGEMYHARVRYRPLPGVLDCWVDPGAWVNFATDVWPNSGDQPEHTIKMVVDLVTHRYVRTMLNDTTYDMMPHIARLAGGGGATFLHAWVLVDRALGSVAPVYIDSVIVTQNEP